MRGLSFSAARGSVFGLLGPNGAGKSTTVKVLSTLSAAGSGAARVAGTDVAAGPEQVRRAIGLVSRRPGTDPMGTATEDLVLAGRPHGMPRHEAAACARELLDRFGRAEAAHRTVRRASLCWPPSPGAAGCWALTPVLAVLGTAGYAIAGPRH
ncbi:ATP-binding cassette domain-containing protein [Streptomyces albus subsp. chlorinus]|uniref:ATP-binding cassette domain-containing protein n=1 Tax=Streptomyces albus TaxID=1888 RepID=UPI0015710AE0|nr:ATP-binding cassette domain-containing protein [Streptomyces albus]NSC19926.1 ATP-binding cassette domain-containing protein [Streptomyces albus subsp. chlorinus]